MDMFIFQEIIIGKPKRIKKTAVVFFLISIAPEFLVLTFLLKFLVFILLFFLCSPFFPRIVGVFPFKKTREPLIKRTVGLAGKG